MQKNLAIIINKMIDKINISIPIPTRWNTIIIVNINILKNIDEVKKYYYDHNIEINILQDIKKLIKKCC